MYSNKFKASLVLLSMSLLPAMACAKTSPYARADLGAAYPLKFSKKDYGSKKAKESFLYGLGAGFDFNEKVRVDASLTRMEKFKFNHMIDGSKTQQNIHSTQFMINGYYDIANVKNFVPYVGAGLGVAYNEAKTYKIIDSDGEALVTLRGKNKTNFAYNVGAGLAYKLSKNFAIDLGYKFYDLGKIQTKAATDSTAAKSKLKTHAITFGVRYTF
jgi:opacity protein-like surface antigen